MDPSIDHKRNCEEANESYKNGQLHNIFLISRHSPLYKKEDALKMEDLKENIAYNEEITREKETAKIILSLKVPQNIKK